MSRCFPFPPPGYERKTRPEDLDLLKEAKCKEKKHKRDKGRKKDKEKEKDGSEYKPRDKKDRKEKHKDKNEKHKEKEKKDRENKDKEKSSISEESTVAQNVKISETKIYPAGNSNDIGYFPNEGKCSALLQYQNGGKPSQSNLPPTLGSEESKLVLELDRRIRDGKSRGSQLPERVDKKDQTIIKNSSEENDDNKNITVDKKMHPQGLKNEILQNLMPIVKSQGEGTLRPLNEENGRRLEDKEKSKETFGIKRGEKEKSKERHGKEKKGEKGKNSKVTDDKAKLKPENKKSDQDKLKDDRRNNLVDFGDNQSTDVSKGANNISVNEGNIKKRKDMVTNGFLHETESRPNKMQKSAPHQSMENGTKSEPFRTPAKPSNDKHAVHNNVPVDSKDQLINGMFNARKPFLSQPNPPTAAKVIDQIAEASKLPQRDFLEKRVTVLNMVDPIAEASRRFPHPDSKYLAEVLTVPKNMSDWSEYDDQDWLFSEKVTRKPKVESFGEDVCVRSEAVRIESADVCALPYVIPY